MREIYHALVVEMHQPSGNLQHLLDARKLEDVERLKERASDLRRHFDMASTDLEKLTTSADRIGKRGTRIENLDVSDDSVAGLPDGARPRLVTGS